MFYDFPRIETLDDVLPAIKGAKEFTVSNRGNYTVVNYQVVAEDTFPPIKSAGGSAKDREHNELMKTIRRECRGLIFDKDGKIISRRYHKFFNLNEREETKEENIDFTMPHQLLEKIDGSMISPVVLDGCLHWTTKMGITDIAQDVQEWVGNKPQYCDLARKAHGSGHTLIFEWTSRKSRVVIDYPRDNLILTGIRNNITGEYDDYSMINAVNQYFDIPIVGLIEAKDLSEIASRENMEGVVVRFDNGHMVKVKTEWYALRHKSKDAITREKPVLEYIFNNQLDDVMPFLEEEDRKKVNAFQGKIIDGLFKTALSLDIKFWKYKKMVDYDRKRFALEIAPNINAHERTIYFRIWDAGMHDHHDMYDQVFAVIKQNLSSIASIESVRHLFGYHRWNYYDIV